MNRMTMIARFLIEGVEIDGNTNNCKFGSYSYQPGNLDSMLGAINQATDSIIQRNLSTGSNIHFSDFRIRFEREDGTIINEFDEGNLLTAKEVINAMLIV